MVGEIQNALSGLKGKEFHVENLEFFSSEDSTKKGKRKGGLARQNFCTTNAHKKIIHRDQRIVRPKLCDLKTIQ